MDPEVLKLVQQLKELKDAAGQGGTAGLVIAALTATVTLIGYLHRFLWVKGIQPFMVRIENRLARREREQSAIVRLIAQRLGITAKQIAQATALEELREKRAAEGRPEADPWDEAETEGAPAALPAPAPARPTVVARVPVARAPDDSAPNSVPIVPT